MNLATSTQHKQLKKPTKYVKEDKGGDMGRGNKVVMVLLILYACACIGAVQGRTQPTANVEAENTYSEAKPKVFYPWLRPHSTWWRFWRPHPRWFPPRVYPKFPSPPQAPTPPSPTLPSSPPPPSPPSNNGQPVERTAQPDSTVAENTYTEAKSFWFLPWRHWRRSPRPHPHPRFPGHVQPKWPPQFPTPPTVPAASPPPPAVQNPSPPSNPETPPKA